MKKILIIHNKYRNTGGEDIAVENEINFLKKYFIVDVLYFENKIDNPISQLFYFVINKNLKSNKILKKRLNQFNPDVIYIHNTWFKASVSVLEESIRSSAQVVLKIHNFRYFCTKTLTSKKHFNEKKFCDACGSSKEEIGFINKYFKESLIKSLLVIFYGKKYFTLLKDGNLKIAVLTKFHKNFMKNLGIPETKIEVFPNFIEHHNIISKNQSQNYLIYAGRISKEKGIESLINSFNEVNDKNYVLKIIGDGPIKENLVKLYSSKNILFYDYMENSKVIEEINNSVGIVTATNLFEGQPTLLCEASSMGVPSIFPNTGGISEFFPANYLLSFEQFNYKDLSEKIRKLIHDIDADKVGQENKNYINKYLNPEELIEKFNIMAGIE